MTFQSEIAAAVDAVFDAGGTEAVFNPVSGVICTVNVTVDKTTQVVPDAFGNYAIGPREIILGINASEVAPDEPTQGDHIILDSVNYRITDVDFDGYEYDCTVIVEDD